MNYVVVTIAVINFHLQFEKKLTEFHCINHRNGSAKQKFYSSSVTLKVKKILYSHLNTVPYRNASIQRWNERKQNRWLSITQAARKSSSVPSLHHHCSFIVELSVSSIDDQYVWYVYSKNTSNQINIHIHICSCRCTSTMVNRSISGTEILEKKIYGRFFSLKRNKHKKIRRNEAASSLSVNRSIEIECSTFKWHIVCVFICYVLCTLSFIVCSLFFWSNMPWLNTQLIYELIGHSFLNTAHKYRMCILCGVSRI